MRLARVCYLSGCSSCSVDTAVRFDSLYGYYCSAVEQLDVRARFSFRPVGKQTILMNTRIWLNTKTRRQYSERDLFNS